MAICSLCPGTNKVPTIKGYCQRHYWAGIKLKSVLKAQERELSEDQDLQTLVNDLDIIFSRYIRLKDADEYGMTECYTCDWQGKYTQLDCGHFIPRAHMYTRFSEQNCKPQCAGCNRVKGGRLVQFAEHLERDNPGSVEILQEQAAIVHKWSREELKLMIAAYDKKVKQLQKGIYQ